MTLDLALWRKAAGACAVAAPHREAGEDWPCSGCLLLSASANAPSTGVVCPPVPGGGALGAAGAIPPARHRPVAPPSGSPHGAFALHRKSTIAGGEGNTESVLPVRVRPVQSTKPRFDDDDDEWDANGWERVPTWERRPR